MKATRAYGKDKRASKLDECEWNFSDSAKVSNEELVAATYYEYARESKTIIEGLREKTDASEPTIIRGLPFGGTPFSERFNVAFREKIREQSFPLWVTLTPKLRPGKSADKPPRFLPCVKPWEPWQRIAEGTRRAICEELAACSQKDPGLPLLPFNRCSDLRDLGVVDASDNYRCAEIDRELRIERLRVEIDWSFSNDQIRKAFKLWLKENRPPFFPESSGKGHDDIDWRARLERLGLLRLRHPYSFGDAKPFLRILPQTAKTKIAGECNREAKKALDDFHILFPFLDSTEMPLCWPIKDGV